jgi:peroxiredoxin
VGQLLSRIAGMLVLLSRLAVAPPTVPDLDGREVDVLAGTGRKAAVLVFVGADCPISNRYAPELQRLQQEFAPRGVAFFLVYPEPSLDAAAARRHQTDYGLSLPALLDSRHRLVAHTGVEVTPEAAVLGPDGAVLYRGRIDDRWVDFNQRRPQARQHDLHDALEAILDGRAPPPAGGRAVGCYIEALPSQSIGTAP